MNDLIISNPVHHRYKKWCSLPVTGGTKCFQYHLRIWVISGSL